MTLGDGTTTGDRSALRLLAPWVLAARANQNFADVGSVIAGLATIIVVILHSALYAANIHNPLAVLGAVAGVLVSVAALIAVTLLFEVWHKARWRAVAGGALLVALALALLPPITAGSGWLTVVLCALVTLVYDVAVAGFLVVLRPWEALRGVRE